MQSFFFSDFPLQPDVKAEREAWEIPYYIAGASSLLILCVGLTYKPKTSIKVCRTQISHR